MGTFNKKRIANTKVVVISVDLCLTGLNPSDSQQLIH